MLVSSTAHTNKKCAVGEDRTSASVTTKMHLGREREKEKRGGGREKLVNTLSRATDCSKP